MQSLLNFRVFLLADKGQKGENSAGSFIHFKTLQDTSPEFLEQTISFTFWLQKISFPDDPDQPNPQNRFYGTNYIPAPEPQEWLWTPIACVVAKPVKSLWPDPESQPGGLMTCGCRLSLFTSTDKERNHQA